MDPDGERIITSDDALTSETLPEAHRVIGAGAVGVEFASVYRSFGAEVTVIEALDRLIPLEDADLSKELAASVQAPRDQGDGRREGRGRRQVRTAA